MSRRIWIVEWREASQPIHYRGTMDEPKTPTRIRSVLTAKTKTDNIRRRTSSRTVENLQQSLHELDETVASVHSLYSHYSQTSTEDGSIQSLTTEFGHSVLTSRFLIKNMERLEMGSTRSGRSSGSRGGRRSLSSSSTRKRGPSLERAISQTILETASTTERAHFLVEDSIKARVPSTEEILNDLNQAHSVLEFEINSAQGNLLPPPITFEDEPDLLPPTEQISWSDPQWQPSWNDLEWSEKPKTVENRQASQNSFDPKSSGTLVTEPESFNASVETFEQNFETTFFTNESDPELQDSLFADDPFATPKWTEFQRNPFSENEKVSSRSPSFIADFTQEEQNPGWNWV